MSKLERSLSYALMERLESSRASPAKWWTATVQYDQAAMVSPEEREACCSELKARLLADAGDGSVQACRFQLEKAAQTGRYHIQLIIKMHKKVRLSSMVNYSDSWGDKVTGCHWEKVHKVEECWNYCGKEDTRVLGPFQIGDYDANDLGSGQGRSEALREVIRVAQESGLRAAAREDAVTFVRYGRGLERLLLYTDPPIEREVGVYLFIGPSRCGKSYKARFDPEFGGGNASRFWVAPVGRDCWFDGYDRQPVAIFDDFAGAASHITLTTFLQVTDPYAARVPVKGGFATFTPERIIITTNVHPNRWYEYEGREEQYRALSNRFTRVLEFRPNPIDRRAFVSFTSGSAGWVEFWGRPKFGPLAGERPRQVYDVDEDMFIAQ